jgi:hypothetical protein
MDAGKLFRPRISASLRVLRVPLPSDVVVVVVVVIGEDIASPILVTIWRNLSVPSKTCWTSSSLPQAMTASLEDLAPSVESLAQRLSSSCR